MSKRLVRGWINIGLAAGVGLMAVIASGCKKEAAENPAPENAAADSTAGDEAVVLVTETEEKEREDFKAGIRAMAVKGEFQKLESMAEEFRSKKSRFASGYWKLRAFYVAFSDYDKIQGQKEWANLLSQLERWAAGQPASITPQLALAEANQGYAWAARGSGWASEVTADGWRLMEQRLQKSQAWLAKARSLPQKDPAIHAISLHLCLGLDVSRKQYEAIFEAGVKESPDYEGIYQYKAYYLLPRWHGKPGEWETFARRITQDKTIPGSEEIFARIVIYLRSIGVFYDEFSGDPKAWEELKASFRALEKHYPDSLEIKSVFCRICSQLDDYKEVREQFKLIGDKVDMSVWETKKNFLATVHWAATDDATIEREIQEKARR